MFFFFCLPKWTNSHSTPVHRTPRLPWDVHTHACRCAYVHSCPLSTTASKHSQQGLIEIYDTATRHTCKYTNAPNLMEILVQFYPFPGCFLRSRIFLFQVFSLKLKIFVNYQREVNLKTQSSPKAGAATAIIGSQNYLLHRIMSLGKMRETVKC